MNKHLPSRLFLIACIGMLLAILTGTVQAGTPGDDGEPAIEGVAIEPAAMAQPGDGASLAAALAAGDFWLTLDDGSAEMSVGIGGSREMLFLNRFTLDRGSYPFALKEIRVFFSTAGDAKINDEITLVVYETPGGSADPALGAALRAQIPVKIKALNIWSIYPLDQPIVLNGPGDLLIGVVAMKKPFTSYLPAAIDMTTNLQRSWAGWWKTSPPPTTYSLPPDASWSRIDLEGYAGNWMIRGLGTPSDRHVFLPLVTR